MQLSQDPGKERYRITHISADTLTVNNQDYHQPLIISLSTLITDQLPAHFSEFTAKHWEPILKLSPSLILLGTGQRQLWPAPEVLAPLYEARIGIEIMDTLAACRTLRILFSENRNAVGLLFL